MKFLTQSKNKHFYYSGKDCLFNGNRESCIMYIPEEHGYGKESGAEFYPSGALMTVKDSTHIFLFYMLNSGEKLFEIKANDLNEMENTIYDINAYPCETGVLVGYQYFDKTYKFEYYTYLGGVFTSYDINELKQKVEKYEKTLGVFYDEQPKNKDAKYTKQILDCYNDKDDLSK